MFSPQSYGFFPIYASAMTKNKRFATLFAAKHAPKDGKTPAAAKTADHKTTLLRTVVGRRVQEQRASPYSTTAPVMLKRIPLRTM